MELVKIAWVVIFLFFALTLLFVWSKMYIIARKIKTIDGLIVESEKVGGTQTGEAEKAPAAK